MKPFLVETIGLVLRFLNRLSPFEYVLWGFRSLDKESTGALTELWVLINLLAATLFFVLLPSSAIYLLRWIVMTYAAVRMLEIVTFQAYTQLYGGYRNKTPRLHYLLLSYRRSIFLAVTLYLEILMTVLIFARIVTYLPRPETADPIERERETTSPD